MINPSFESSLIKGVQFYLTAEFALFNDNAKQGAIAFDTYTNTISPQENPKGSVFLAGITPRTDANLKAQRHRNSYQFTVKLLVCELGITAGEAHAIFIDWQIALQNTLFKLRETGLSGTYRNNTLRQEFRNITIKPSTYPEIQPYQLEGGVPDAVVAIITIEFVYERENF